MSATNFAKSSNSILPCAPAAAPAALGGLAAVTAVFSETGSSALRFLGVMGGTFALVVRGAAFARVTVAAVALPLVVRRGSCDSVGWAWTSFGDLPAPKDGRPRDCRNAGAGIITRMTLHASSACEMMDGERAGSRVRCAWMASHRWSEA